MKSFTINGLQWKVVTVPHDSHFLIDRTGQIRVATTDPETLCIYVSDAIYGDFQKMVIAHEIGHAVCFSYGLISDIHKCCYPSKKIEMEEMLCNFVADYGELIFEITYSVLGDEALIRLPAILSRAIPA